MSDGLEDTVGGIFQALHGNAIERLVIVGAGSSAEAGLPTGELLHKELAGLSPVYANVAAALGESGDVERVFRVIEMIAASAESNSESADFAKVTGSSILETGPAKAAIEDVRRHLRQRLWLPVSLLGSLVGPQQQEDSPAGYLRPLVKGQRGGTIVSLNYDNALEVADPSVLTRMQYSKRIVVPSESVDRTRLLKLHGSLDWQRISDDVVKSGLPVGGVDYEPAIVFGAGNKLRYYGPFLSLFEAFRQRLMRSRVVVTIGYSFRDPHVTDAIRVWAHERNIENKRLLVGIGPGRSILPRPVVEMDVAEGLEVQPYPVAASTMIRTIFG